MEINPEELRALYPNVADYDGLAAAVSSAWEEFGFSTRNARAGYLAICSNETGGFREMKRESMMYSPSRSRVVFGSERATRCEMFAPLSDGGGVARDDRGEAFANCIYANMIGNGDAASGDGWRFRGLSLVQLTGRANYDAAAKALGMPLSEMISHLEAGDIALGARLAAWFMAKYVKIVSELDKAEESAFLAAATKVGHAVDGGATRLAYRRSALKVVRPKGTVRDPDTGNVSIADIKDSKIVKDSNVGQVLTGGGGSVITSVAIDKGVEVITSPNISWEKLLVLGLLIVAIAACAGGFWYFRQNKKSRLQMHADGIV